MGPAALKTEFVFGGKERIQVRGYEDVEFRMRDEIPDKDGHRKINEG
jgi:hypothetical protein